MPIQIFWMWLALAGMPAPEHAQRVYDNTCVTQHLQLLQPVEAMAGDADAGAQFLAALTSAANTGDRIDDPLVLAWMESLLTRAGRSTTGLRLQALGKLGCRNYGVFAVHTDDGAYVAKRGNRMYEPVRWATLQMNMFCYPRENDPRDRNPGAVWLPGDEMRRARVMPLIAWDYTVTHDDSGDVPVLPTMLFEHARGAALEVPDPARLDDYTPAEQEAFLSRANALGVSLALLQVPGLFGSSREHVFERATWLHDDLHPGNMFFDEALGRIELVDCIEMRRTKHWHKDLQALVLHRDLYPVEHPLRRAWSRALAEGYLSRTTGVLHDELRNAFSGTLIYSKPDLNASDKRALIW